MIRKILLFIFLIGSFISLNAQNQVIYVDSAATGTADGSSWGNAYPYLVDALEAANANTSITEIQIAKGTYYPTRDKSSTDRNASFVITRGGLNLKGGYPTGGAATPQGYLQDQGTILSGNIGDASTADDNSLHVIVILNASGNDTLSASGIQISDGHASISEYIEINGKLVSGGDGGGVYIDYANIPIEFKNCIFTRNYAFGFGGGIFLNTNNSLSITNCLFNKNLNAVGAAIYSYSNNLTIRNSTITGHDDIAIFPELHSQLTVVNSIMWGNYRDIRTEISFIKDLVTVFFEFSILPDYFFLDDEQKGIRVESLNPLFVDPGNNNFQLQTSSPAIDYGNPNYLLPSQTTDLAGNPRIVGLSTDLGVYEHQIFNNYISNNQSDSYNGMAGSMEISGSELTSGVQPVTYEWVIQITGNTDSEAVDTLVSINLDSLTPFITDALRGYGIQLDSNQVKVDDMSKFPELFDIISNESFPEDMLSFQGEIKFSRLATAGGSPDISNQLNIDILAEATPVKIIDFSGQLQANQASLSWQTGIETSLSHFILERKENSINGANSDNWQKVASISAKGSNSHYLFTTPQQKGQGIIYYRLKSVDRDGSESYHDKIIHLGESNEATVKVYPNPATDRFFINLQQPASLVLYDQLGRKVQTVPTLKAGLNIVNINNLSAGRYFGKLSTAEQFSFIKK